MSRLALALLLASPDATTQSIPDLEISQSQAAQEMAPPPQAVSEFQVSLQEAADYQDSDIRFALSSNSCTADGYLVRHFLAVGMTLEEDKNRVSIPAYREDESFEVTSARFQNYVDGLRKSSMLISTTRRTFGAYGSFLQLYSLSESRFGLSLDQQDGLFSNAFRDFVISSGYVEYVEALTERPVNTVVTYTGSHYEESEGCRRLSEAIQERMSPVNYIMT